MIELTNTSVFGWEAAIRGMRNPMNSWEKSDSNWTDTIFNEDTILLDYDTGGYAYILGKNDAELMKKLAAGGPVHAKYRRMITVYVDINAPLYWWKEFDTYKVGTVANSCSTMHKIHSKEFTLDDFSCEHLMSYEDVSYDPDNLPSVDLSGLKDGSAIFSPKGILKYGIIPILNQARETFLETGDKKYWWQMIQLLPSSYNQKRTIMLNYEVLSHIYPDRKDHKLNEWQGFCHWIELLPYSEIIIGSKEE